ncbi:TIGR02391 family protein [Halomicroarcula sp. GCM10025894]|uniref:TIGR02391 family protein n=1 Tax=Halomicroarcula sp. GCM10025894 TaxID=3252673 RepID=UPI00361CC95B
MSLAYERGVAGSTEPFFLDGLLEDHLYAEFSEYLGDEERPDPNEITESEVLRVIRLNYELNGVEEPDLQSGVRTYFLTLDAAGLGEYKLATANTEHRIVFRDDITIEDLADGDADSLRRPGAREVADPSEIFHDGFDEQLLTRISPQFRYGLFQDAVGTAYTVLEDRIRDKGNFSNEDHGQDLMSKAFDGDSGPLAMGNASAEKEGFKLLYMGAYMSLRNPPSHRILDDMNKQQAQDAISMVNFLLTLVENQK